MKKRAIIAVGTYAFIIVILALTPLKVPEDAALLSIWYDESENKIILPKEFLLRETGRIYLKTSYDSDGTGSFLILPPMWIHGIEVDLNGKTVFNLGTENRYITLPNIYLLIKLDDKSGRNSLLLKINGVYTVSFRWIPYITKEPPVWVGIANVVFLFANSLAFGGLVITVAYLLTLLFMRQRIYYLYFSLGFTTLAFFMLHLVLTGVLIEKDLYLNFIKFTWALNYLTLPLMLMSFDSVTHGRVKKTSWFLLIIGVLLGFVSYNLHSLDFLMYAIPLFFFTALLGIYKGFKSDFWEFKLGACVVFATIFQHGLWFMGALPFPTLIGHGVIVTLVIFVTFLASEYKKIEMELFETKRELFIDPLTKAYNRRIIDISNFGCSDSIIFFDINNFKKLNDTYGHEYGDGVLRRFCDLVKKVIRKGDILVRYGGDEFLVILKNCDNKNAAEIADKIAEDFEKNTGVAVSWGIAGCCHGIEEAIKIADKMMYKMKSNKYKD